MSEHDPEAEPDDVLDIVQRAIGRLGQHADPAVRADTASESSSGRPTSSQRWRRSRVKRGRARGRSGMAPHSWAIATWS